MIHTSELSWKTATNPNEIVHVGDELDVMVLNVDQEKERISLSLRRLSAETWTTITEAFEIGQIVTGTITRLTTFGAFAQIEGGIEGLVHISELSDKHITHPKEAVAEGQVLELKILNLDPERHRLGLSRRRVVEEM